jgi:hypothetical protein
VFFIINDVVVSCYRHGAVPGAGLAFAHVRFGLFGAVRFGSMSDIARFFPAKDEEEKKTVGVKWEEKKKPEKFQALGKTRDGRWNPRRRRRASSLQSHGSLT